MRAKEAVAWFLFGFLGGGLVTITIAFWRLADRLEDVRRKLIVQLDQMREDLSGRLDRVKS